MASRRDCQEACLSEFNFVCRSAEYDTKTLQCKLSSSDKHSRPDVFVDAATHVEYLENRCGRAQCVDDWNTVEDMQPRYVDLVVSNVTDERSCRQLCSANAAFACRSYSFQPTVSQCLISSENRGILPITWPTPFLLIRLLDCTRAHIVHFFKKFFAYLIIKLNFFIYYFVYYIRFFDLLFDWFNHLINFLSVILLI